MAYDHTVLERMTVMLSSPIQMIPSIDAHTSVRARYLSLTSCLYSSIFAGEGIAIDASGLFSNTSMTKLQLREEILVSMSMQAPDPRYQKQSPCTFDLDGRYFFIVISISKWRVLVENWLKRLQKIVECCVI